MLDAALIAQCADPSLTPAIVERFVEVAGSDDPLAITVRWGDKTILVPKPTTAEEALGIVRQHAGMATVRVGITQTPVGHGVGRSEELSGKPFDPCENLRAGTAIFAKIARIVTRWYGNPTDSQVLPQLFEDAVLAWKSGVFEGQKVFLEEDPGGQTFLIGGQSEQVELFGDEVRPSSARRKAEVQEGPGIRVDLSRIGVDP
ncbi:hypothetical protein J2T09_003359 [Neorhizobium huautlense]|uniref:Conjugal transfer protein TraH n=1 Tax=Neorhizobium huautlense TaxID=67774 RepID=A0ABT9PVY9_9HYPH|nr:conjugal transfer protein TraH [Neorhizobium huautlense]MDP9838587.1 hypothetical protein [Neorhizobium huautlense]